MKTYEIISTCLICSGIGILVYGLFPRIDMDYLEKQVQYKTEKAYSEGQKDALLNDIRFDHKNECWIASPWDCNQTVITYKMCD